MATDSSGQHLLTPGQVFHGHYEVVRLLGAGGMGAVYEARHTQTGGLLALKLMLPNLLDSAQMRERFQQEAQVIAKLRSDHVAQIYHAGIDPDTAIPFIAMELLEGEDLSQMLERRGRFEPELVIELFRHAALVLDKAHALGVVHRDLKPGNMFVVKRDDGSRCLKLLDFGISKIVAGGAGENTGPLGTPCYMAPEQLQPGATVDHRTDIYALAHVVYTVLCGQSYWSRELREIGVTGVAVQIVLDDSLQAASERARENGVQLPPAFDQWFACATHREAENRYGNVAEMVDALAAVFQAIPTQAARPANDEAPSHEASPSATATVAIEDMATDAFIQHVGVAVETTGAEPLAAENSAQSAGTTAPDVNGSMNAVLDPYYPPPAAGVPVPPAVSPTPSSRSKIWLGLGVGAGLVIIAAAIVAAIVFIPNMETEFREKKTASATKKVKISNKPSGKTSDEGIKLSNATCRQDRDCEKNGTCVAQGDRCVADSTEDCRKSKGCRTYGRCTAQRGSCVVASDENCKQSDQCKKFGACRRSRGFCIAVSEADCRASLRCKRSGKCILRGTKCEAR